MESSEILSSRSAGNPLRVWAEKVFDGLVLSAVIVAPAGLLFALAQFSAGAALWGVAGLVIAALGALGIYARLVAPFWLQVKHIQVQPAPGATPLARPLKVVFFSDLHVGRVKQAAWARKVVQHVNAQQPDLVLLGGDFVGHVDASVLPTMLAPLGELRAPLGVYAVLGNHDYGIPGEDLSGALAALFRELKVRLLKNECVALSDGLQLVGIDELWGGYGDPARAFAQCAPAGASDTRRIVLGHNPDLLMCMDERADFFIFGHTHGGQVYIPYFSRYLVPVDGPLYRGEHHLPQGHVYISAGCGETTTPTRLGTRAEIVSVTLL
jgi:predicted MPP superfamily phosphohydrolase